MGNSNTIARVATPTERDIVHRLQTLISTPYSEQEHLVLLKRIWAASEIPSEFKRISSEWKTFGFQREDPVSDIRGGGVLALQNMLWFLENDHAGREMLKARRARTGAEGYPWAAAGINVTRMLCEILEVTKQSGAPSNACEAEERRFWHLCSSMKRFHTLYAFAFKMLDDMFTTEEATYMDFNRVMQQTKGRLMHVVSNEQSALPPLLRSEEAQPEDGETLDFDQGMEASGSNPQATQALLGGSLGKKGVTCSPSPSLSSSPATSCGGVGKGHLHDYLSQPLPLPSPHAVEPIPAPHREEVIRDKHDGHMGGGAGSLSHRRKSSTGGRHQDDR